MMEGPQTGDDGKGGHDLKNGDAASASAAAAAPQEVRPKQDIQLPVFSYYVGELSLYEVSSENYLPLRARLCHALCDAFDLEYERKAPLLATRTDLGQFHADNYLGLLQIVSDLWVSKGDEKARKRQKAEGMLVKERLAMFDLDLPDQGVNAVFAGLYAYHRLCVTGSLAAAQMLMDGSSRIAINWFGGHTRARKARAVDGCYVNDDVVACLSLLRKFDRVLHISMDESHCDGVEEAFYTTDRVATVSFHTVPSLTGLEDDNGHGQGLGFAVNVPLDPQCFTDDHFVPLFARIVKQAKEHFSPSAVVFVASPSVLTGNRGDELNLSLKGYLDCLEVVKSLDLPLLILGGAGRSVTVAARAWCAATAKCLGTDVSTLPVPQSCPYIHHFNLSNFQMDIPAVVDVKSIDPKGIKLDVDQVKALEQRIIERLSNKAVAIVKEEADAEMQIM